MRDHNNHQPNIAGLYNLRIAVEKRNQRFSEEQNQRNGNRQGDRPLDKAEVPASSGSASAPPRREFCPTKVVQA